MVNQHEKNSILRRWMLFLSKHQSSANPRTDDGEMFLWMCLFANFLLAFEHGTRNQVLEVINVIV